MATKDISAYGGLTATNIKTKADIPAQADMTVDGTTVKCQNVSISAIKYGIRAGYNTLSALCKHSGINIWSGFGPIEWDFGDVGYLESFVKYPYSASNFAGYNHQAVGPALSAVTSDFSVYTGNNNVSYTAKLTLGEVPWMTYFTELASVNMAVYYGAITGATPSFSFTLSSTDANHADFEYTDEDGETVYLQVDPGYPEEVCARSIDVVPENGLSVMGSSCGLGLFGQSHITISSSNYLTTQYTFLVSGTTNFTGNTTVSLLFYFGRSEAYSWSPLSGIPSIPNIDIEEINITVSQPTTTTTTTTISPNCRSYSAENSSPTTQTFYYTDCYGASQEEQVLSSEYWYGCASIDPTSANPSFNVSDLGTC